MSRYNLNKTVFLSEEFVSDLLDMTRSFKRLADKVGNTYEVVYGFDHAFYYFLQLEPEQTEDVAPDFGEDEMAIDEYEEWENSLIDIDTVFDGLTGSDLGYFLRKVGAPYDHIENCFLDLPI